MAKTGNKFFVKHAKSSAALVSLGIHAVLVLIALSFVAVTVIQKEEKIFDAKPVSRPKMQLKKLQVPVNIKKKKVQKPKLRKRIVVQPKLNKNMPDIKMPEITGVKGGLGNAGGDGLGGAGGIGFSMPEIDVFGIKGKGEKVFIMLDASDEMMYDEMGGIPAYTIIKDELVKILGGLPPTALFNIAVYDKWNTYLLFPNLVAASSVHVGKVEEWLKPLNTVRPGMGVGEWGPRTLGPGGIHHQDDYKIGDFQRLESWHRPAMISMRQQADAVFVLTSWWGYQRYPKEEKDNSVWLASSVGKRYLEKYQEALKLLEEENRKRIAQGNPPRVLNRHDKRLMVHTYFEGIEVPPEPEYYYHKPEEYIKGMLEVWAENITDGQQSKSGLRRKGGKAPCSFSVVRFVKADAERSKFKDERSVTNFKKMTGYFKGSYRELAGLEAVKSSVSSN